MLLGIPERFICTQSRETFAAKIKKESFLNTVIFAIYSLVCKKKYLVNHNYTLPPLSI
jgi:hypothetical protein